jgi:tRNA threonylcarbamoyladenosine biosynthesis protein TsaB
VTHGQRLPGDLQRVLDAAGLHLDAIDLLAIVAGPGSFTGLRVGIATVQGLAFSRGLRIVPVSTFDALAEEAYHSLAGDDPGPTRASDPEPAIAGRTGWLVAPWVDAQRGEVFASLIGPGLERTLAPPSSATPSQTLATWRDRIGEHPIFFAGDGALRYRNVIVAAFGAQARILDRVPRLAGSAGRIAARDPRRAVLPHAVVPVYVRRPDAELALERGVRVQDPAPHTGTGPEGAQ